jgi:hypothetical protein
VTPPLIAALAGIGIAHSARQKSDFARCGSRASGQQLLLSPVREPVLEALYVQCAASEYSNLNLHRIGSVILVEQMPEIEGARNGRRLPFQGAESSALL